MKALLTATTPMLACKDTLSEKLSGKFFSLQKGRGSKWSRELARGSADDAVEGIQGGAVALAGGAGKRKKELRKGASIFRHTFIIRTLRRDAVGGRSGSNPLQNPLAKTLGILRHSRAVRPKIVQAWIHPSRSSRTLHRLTVFECMSGLSAMTSLLLPLAASRRILPPDGLPPVSFRGAD